MPSEWSAKSDESAAASCRVIWGLSGNFPVGGLLLPTMRREPKLKPDYIRDATVRHRSGVTGWPIDELNYVASGLRRSMECTNAVRNMALLEWMEKVPPHQGKEALLKAILEAFNR